MDRTFEQAVSIRQERDELRAEIARLRDAMERAIANLDDNFARRVLIRSLSRKEPREK